MICKYVTRGKSDRSNVSLIISEEASCITNVLRFDSNASMKGSRKCEYTPGFGGSLIVIVTSSRIVDGIIVGGIRICLLHMRGVQQ